MTTAFVTLQCLQNTDSKRSQLKGIFNFWPELCYVTPRIKKTIQRKKQLYLSLKVTSLIHKLQCILGVFFYQSNNY